MKIAFVTHALSSAGGGVATVVEALSGALLDRGDLDVRVFGLADGRWPGEAASWTGAPAEGFPTTGPGAVGYAPGLRQALAAFNPDLVHTHGIWMYPSAVVADWAQGTRSYIVSPHGMLDPWALQTSRLKKAVARRLFEDRHLAGAASLHALNMAEADAIRDFGLSAPIATIPNGVALTRGKPTTVPAWTAKFGLSARVLLFLGRLHPKKNVESLLHAVARLKAEDRMGQWNLAIAGWGPEKHVDRLKALTEELGLGSITSFVGALGAEAKDAALHHASAFVLPSHSEGLPMAVLEAWAHGLPVAMTNSCNLPEGFQSGAAIEIPTAPDGMIGPLGTFLSLDAATLAAMGQRGRHLVEKRYTWSAVAATFSEVYGSLLPNATSAGAGECSRST